MIDQEARYKEIGAKARATFSSGDYTSAIKHFSDAINLKPNNHALYSNRSCCYSSLKQYEYAFTDAKKCIELKPDFPSGYFRKAVAEQALGRYDDAVLSYKEALKLQPDCEEYKSALEKAEEVASEHMFGSYQNIVSKISSNVILRKYLEKEDFKNKLKESQGKTQKLFELMKTDPRFISLFSILTNIPMEEVIKVMKEKYGDSFKTEVKEETKKTENEEEKNKKLAEEEKTKGNTEYKSKNFEEALKHYDAAIQYSPKEPIYYLNKASVFIEQKKYTEALEICETALKVAEEISPRPLQKIAKAYARKGNCHMQMKEFDKALEAYDKSLIEANDSTVKENRKNCLKLKTEYEEQAYFDPEKSEKHKENGNKYFRDGNYVEAMKEYNEAIKRNPKNSVIYLNRALTFLKTLEYKRALEDVDMSLKLDPKYVKAYAKKGNIYRTIKIFHKALSAYEAGLKLDPTNSECLEGIRLTEEEMYRTPPSQERYDEAVKDDEIRALMSDPRVRNMVQEMSSNPNGVKNNTTDPFLSQAIRKLIAAGILGMR